MIQNLFMNHQYQYYESAVCLIIKATIQVIIEMCQNCDNSTNLGKPILVSVMRILRASSHTHSQWIRSFVNDGATMIAIVNVMVTLDQYF